MGAWMTLLSNKEKKLEDVAKIGNNYQICYLKTVPTQLSNVNYHGGDTEKERERESLNNDFMKKDLIYLCLFGDKKYTVLLDLLLESIALYCDKDHSFDILIYTSTEIEDEIRKVPSISNLTRSKRLIFQLNDSKYDFLEFLSSRLDVFDFPQTKEYKRILYLDTDIIVTKSLAPLFGLIKEDKLYALEEPGRNIPQDFNEYFGKALFGREIDNYQDKSVFNSGILLFNNCEAIKNLFRVIKTDIIQRINTIEGKFLLEKHKYLDQPFINYNTKKLNIGDSKTLKSYVTNCIRGNFSPSTETIVHFCGGVSANSRKVSSMKQYLSELKSGNRKK
jgi:hypothetical protein